MTFLRVLFSGNQGTFVAVMLILGVIYSLSWTGFFLRPVAMTMNAEETVFVRETPLGLVNAEWMIEISQADGTECRASGLGIYQNRKDNVARVDTPLSLRRCLVGTVVLEGYWTLRVLGVPLRPVRYATILETGK